VIVKGLLFFLRTEGPLVVVLLRSESMQSTDY
jgi:hypothetical protein